MNKTNEQKQTTSIIDIQLEKNIPIPPNPTRLNYGKWQELVDSADIGDSFIVPAQKCRSIAGCVRPYAKVTMRKIDEDFVRVWILEKK